MTIQQSKVNTMLYITIQLTLLAPPLSGCLFDCYKVPQVGISHTEMTRGMLDNNSSLGEGQLMYEL